MGKIENRKVAIYIVLAFVFSVLVRLIWVYQFHGQENFIWNDQFMINTNDGYFWAEGARDILNWDFKEFALSPVKEAGSQLPAFFAFILPFSFETVILYLPVFLSSLVVIPMILIAQSLKRLEVGLVAALLASIAWSYYNRTMIGYFDTDMLNIVFPMFLLWSLILAFRTQDDKYLIFTALEIIAYRAWYPQSYSLEFAFFGLILLYTFVFERKNSYMYKLLIIMLVAMMGLDGVVRFVSVISIYMLYKKRDDFELYMYKALGIAFALFLFTGGVAPIWGQLKGYVFTDTIESVGSGLQLHFFSVIHTIREAGKIPFETFANRISGHTITFLLSCAGYVMMIFRYRVMLLGLPLVGLGFLAYVGGLRFTIYAVPIMAFGMAYFIFFIGDYIKNKQLKIAFIVACTVAVLYPNIMHVIAYRVPTVFTKQEVVVLDKLKKVASREDYVVAWWDYGYPVRYYSDVNTLIDGGKHSGAVNFTVSYMLTSPQKSAAKLARLDVEYTEKIFRIRQENRNKSKENSVLIQSNIAQMTLDSGVNETNYFLSSLNEKTSLPKKTRDIYFYLPYRMMGIMPTITKFSNIDLMIGKTNRRPFFYKTNRFKDSGSLLNLDSGVVFNKKSGMLKIGDQEVPIKEFLTTTYDKKGKLVRQRQTIHKDAKMYLIYMRSYNTFLVLDEGMLNSTYIQLFVFENYDKNLFEPVVLDPNAKVFKLKI